LAEPLVLVVDDEPLLRLSAVAVLEDAGYATLQAGSADKAIQQLEANAGIRAVFTDIDMPGGMDGLQLAAVIRDRWPPVELLVTSGHVSVEDGQLPERGHFLPKPYSPHQLTRALETLRLPANSR
jgi:CheY-like chemotaxis protein